MKLKQVCNNIYIFILFIYFNNILDDPTIIYDGNLALNQLENKVKKPEDGYDMIDSLYVIIVINNTFLTKMGISMERITRKSADKMPYYLVLKMNTEFDTLNSHILSLVNVN